MKVNAVSLNETRHFNFQEADKAYIKEVRSTYAYNPESCTHLCELTPSYELRFLHTYIIWEGEPSEDKREELENRYCHEGSEDTYMHCADVRQFAKDHSDAHKECGEFDSMDDACEYLQGNWPL